MLSLGWRNLWRHKRRTWLTVGAMIFSNILLVFMITLQLGNYEMMIENSLKSYSGQLQISAKGYFNDPKIRLVLENVEAKAQQIRTAMPELKVTIHGESFLLASSKQRSFGIQIAGVDVEHEPTVSSIPGLIRQGRYLQMNQDNEIIVGTSLARNLKVGIGDEVTLIGSGLDGSIAAAVVTICGIFESGISELDRSVAQMSLRNFQTLFSMPNKGHTIVVNSDDVADAEYYQAQIRSLLSPESHGLEVLNWKQLNPGLQQAIKSDMVSAWFMYGVLVVLVAFSVLNTQLMSILERTREFGIMTAIGLRPNAISRLVLLETGIMAGLGFVIGSACGFALALWLNQTGITFPGMEEMAVQYNLPETMHPAVNPVSIFAGPLTVFLGCLLAAVYPVIRLRSLEPVAAMRAA